MKFDGTDVTPITDFKRSYQVYILEMITPTQTYWQSWSYFN